MKGLGARFSSAINSRQLEVGMRSGCLPPLPGLGPVLDRRAGDRGDVVAGLPRHGAGAGEPFLHAARAGVVGGGRKPEIAELLAQLGQKLGRLRQRLHGIEGIEQAAFAGGSRHELRDALRALAAPGHRADRVGPEAALLPDHAREELQRQVRLPRRGFDHQAHRLAGVGLALRSGFGGGIASSSTLGRDEARRRPPPIAGASASIGQQAHGRGSRADLFALQFCSAKAALDSGNPCSSY